MIKIEEFLKDSPNLKIFLFGLAFAMGALWILLTLFFTICGEEPFVEELGSALLWSMSFYLIISFIGVALAIWDDIRC